MNSVSERRLAYYVDKISSNRGWFKFSLSSRVYTVLGELKRKIPSLSVCQVNGDGIYVFENPDAVLALYDEAIQNLIYDVERFNNIFCSALYRLGQYRKKCRSFNVREFRGREFGYQCFGCWIAC